MKKGRLEYVAGRFGLRAVPTGIVRSVDVEAMRRDGVSELELNSSLGWQGDNIEFVRGLPDLKVFSIVDLQIKSIEAIHSLADLRVLEVSTYCATPIDFGCFPELIECALEWRPGSASLFEQSSLIALLLNSYSGRSSAPFSNLVNLRSLSILNSPIEDLIGLEAVKGLRFLRLANLRRIQSLAGIEDLIELEELDINTCRGVGSIDEVSTLYNLKKMYLNNMGDIASLHPILGLKGLREIVFYETTNIIDGDISPIKQQSALSRISYRNRRHYSHKREDFGAAYKR